MSLRVINISVKYFLIIHILKILLHIFFPIVGTTDSQRKQTQHLLDSALILFAISNVTVGIFSVLHCIYYPTALIYPYSLTTYWNTEQILSPLFKTGLYILSVISWLLFSTIALSTGTQLFDFIFSNIIRCHFLSKQFRLKNWCKQNLSIEELFVSYRSYELVVSLFSKYFSAHFVPFHFTLAPGVLCANYILIKNSSELDPLVRFVFMWFTSTVVSFWITMLTVSGWLHLNFVKTTRSWLQNIELRRKDRILLNMFRKSCRPLYMGNNMVKVNTKSTGKFITVISRDTFRTVLTFRFI